MNVQSLVGYHINVVFVFLKRNQSLKSNFFKYIGVQFMNGHYEGINGIEIKL
jgi:hypothetical protein